MVKILVVEDSPAMRGMIASILDDVDDCEVREAEGGYEALKQLARTQFDLIITDINMPDLNGLELLSYVRKNPSYADTPVLIVTSEEAQSEHDKGVALGANAVISKPFNEDDLLAEIRRLLELS